MIKAFVGINVADSITTYTGLSLGALEGNPIVATGMNTIGVAPALAIKVIAASFIGYVLWRKGKARLLIVPTILLAMLAISNSVQAMIYHALTL